MYFNVCTNKNFFHFYRQMQTVQLDSKIKILDSPGIVFHSGSEGDASVALKNALRVASLKDPVTPATAILKRAHKHTLVALYCIPEFETPQVCVFCILCLSRSYVRLSAY